MTATSLSGLQLVAVFLFGTATGLIVSAAIRVGIRAAMRAARKR